MWMEDRSVENIVRINIISLRISLIVNKNYFIIYIISLLSSKNFISQ